MAFLVVNVFEKRAERLQILGFSLGWTLLSELQLKRWVNIVVPVPFGHRLLHTVALWGPRSSSSPGQAVDWAAWSERTGGGGGEGSVVPPASAAMCQTGGVRQVAQDRERGQETREKHRVQRERER